MSKHEYFTLVVFGCFNLVVSGLVLLSAWAFAKFPGIRAHILSAIQNADGITHYDDGKNFVLFICGLLSGYFTACLGFIFVFSMVVTAESVVILTVFCAVTFTLLGRSWKKPV